MDDKSSCAGYRSASLLTRNDLPEPDGPAMIIGFVVISLPSIVAYATIPSISLLPAHQG